MYKRCVKPFPVKTTIATTSNDFFPEIKEQVISRLLFVNLKKGDFIPEYFNYQRKQNKTFSNFTSSLKSSKRYS